MTIRAVWLTATLALLTPALAAAQTPAWAAEVSVGYAGFVDDSTKNYFLFGGGVRRSITPRISVGPELVVMTNGHATRDRNVMLTGNIVFDAYPPGARVTPFLVGGVGMFWGRDQVRNGPYWAGDPAFTAGGGVRARLGETVTAGAEYRIGWELHQRVSGFAGVRW